MTIKIRKCTLQDLHTLQEISIQTFDETFRAKNKPENIEAYLKMTFQSSLLAEELAHPSSEFYFIYYNNQLAGYLKVNTSDAQTEKMDKNSLEIERLYLLSSFQKKGLGDELMKFAFKRAKELNKHSIWLGVWEKNENAVVFYKKYGFEKVGAHSFYMGDEEQVDWIFSVAL
jgi:ribosomal protein S18 acetylase RimI-like enzyme